MNIFLILSGYRERAVCVSRPISSRFLFVVLEEERSKKKKRVDTPDQLLARILDAAARVKKRED